MFVQEVNTDNAVVGCCIHQGFQALAVDVYEKSTDQVDRSNLAGGACDCRFVHAVLIGSELQDVKLLMTRYVHVVLKLQEVAGFVNCAGTVTRRVWDE